MLHHMFFCHRVGVKQKINRIEQVTIPVDYVILALVKMQ